MSRRADPLRLAAARAFGVAVRGGSPQALLSVADADSLELALSYAENPRGLAQPDAPAAARLRDALAASQAAG